MQSFASTTDRMSKQLQALEALRKTGNRVTPQRVFILEAFAKGSGHLAVDDVYERVKETYPYVDVATIYRTLGLFKKLGLVTQVQIGDRLHYELTDPNGAHHHMVCNSCGQAFNLSPGYLEGFRKSLVKEFSFEPDLAHFTVAGVCARCAPEESKDAQQADR